jgi:transposase
LEKGLRSSSAFTVRRSQIVLMSSQEGLKAGEIAERLRCSDQCVREAIRAFEAEGIACLEPKSRARHTSQRAVDVAGGRRLQEVIRQSPRLFGYEDSAWTQAHLADLLAREGLTGRTVDADCIGRTLKRLGVRWKQAKHWINSPDELYPVKKSGATG